MTVAMIIFIRFMYRMDMLINRLVIRIIWYSGCLGTFQGFILLLCHHFINACSTSWTLPFHWCYCQSFLTIVTALKDICIWSLLWFLEPIVQTPHTKSWLWIHRQTKMELHLILIKTRAWNNSFPLYSVCHNI